MSLFVTVLATGCGGGPASPSVTPYTQTVAGSVATFGTTRHSLDIPRSGQMRLTLTWDSAEIDLDLYITAASCQQLYPQNQCGIVLTSNSAVATQETVARNVTSGEAYAIFVDNLNTIASTTYTLQIRID